MSSLRLLSGSSYRDLAKLVSERIGYPLSLEALNNSRFSNGETFVTIDTSVRGADVFIIQTACEPVNDNLMELLIAISACRMASAKRITAVMPCFPYARQDRKDRSRAPITAKLVATMLEGAGCNHVIVDNGPARFADSRIFQHPGGQLYAEKVVISYIQSHYRVDDLVIVSPDAGGVKRQAAPRYNVGQPHGANTRRRAAAIADKLRVDLAIIHKERKVANQVSRMILVGSVAGKVALLVDDIADTCGTLALAARILKDNGASRSVAMVTHGFLSGPSVAVIESSELETLVVANTLPLPEHAKACTKIQQMDVSPVLGEAIRRTYHGESISMLFS